MKKVLLTLALCSVIAVAGCGKKDAPQVPKSVSIYQQLNLTPEQNKKLADIRAAQRQKMEAIRKGMEEKRNTLLEFGFEDERQLIFSNVKKKKEYYDTLEQRFKEIYGWDKVYQAYHIIYNRKNVITALPHDQIELQKLAINEKVIDKINLQAENIAEEKGINSDNVVEMLLDGEDVGFTYPLVYVEVQKMLAEKLLRINNKIDN